eukprot:CAMPEP_0118632272 /NCGR_PEP_ID=MMETSP0785-20121206/355_1 /TAXON_ID=91992 /ORGANISM="Bolidomonas pacifica, Strain CCMP 1866" /LENGTH=41 /DNA_ID= /DNA_START= /DNA_END= /DNA_ORIENTATION=
MNIHGGQQSVKLKVKEHKPGIERQCQVVHCENEDDDVYCDA